MTFNTFYVRKKPFSFGRRYEISDEYDSHSFYAKSKIFSLSDLTILYDSYDRKIYEIRKKPFSFRSEYFILENGVKKFRLFKKIVAIHPELFVESLTDTEAFYIQGDWFRHEYIFMQEGHKFATVSKKLLSLHDNYVVNIDKNHDVSLVLAVVLIIDLIKKKEK